MAAAQEVHADLVRAAGPRSAAEVRRAPESFEHVDACHGRAPGVESHRHPRRIVDVAAQGQVDDVLVVGRFAEDERAVLLFDPPAP